MAKQPGAGKEGHHAASRPRKARVGSREALKADLQKLAFVDEATVTISDGISAEDAVRPPRDMFPPGPEGDHMWLNFDPGDFNDYD